MLQRPCPVRQVSGFINESVFIHRYVFPYNRGYWSVPRDNAVMYGRAGVYYVCTYVRQHYIQIAANAPLLLHR